MRILIISQYFPPEIGATQNRVGGFARALRARGHDVAVVCEQPCHPAGVFHPGFGRRPLRVSDEVYGTVSRLWVAASRRATRSRRLAFYGSFAVGCAAATLLARRPHVVFASSPPLPGTLAAVAAARARRIPIVADIRDLWPAAAEALGELGSPTVITWLERAERWLYRSATRVTATTKPFCRHIDRIAGHGVSVHLPNGALDELAAQPHLPPPHEEPFTVGYAGNLGIAQGLTIALDAATELEQASVRFVLMGDGPVASDLRNEIAARDLGNVEIRSPVPVEEVGSFLRSCHALLVPLRDHPLFDDFIPSKLYDALAVGRPVLVAARGEAPALIAELGAGVVVPPEDGMALAAAVRSLAEDPSRALTMGAAARRAGLEHTRSRQADVLEAVLLQAAVPTPHGKAGPV